MTVFNDADTMHEIHITVPPPQLTALKKFVATKFPPVDTPHPFNVHVHHFVNHARPPVEDVMTGEPCKGAFDRAMFVAGLRTEQMKRAKFTPLRVKIEAPATTQRVVHSHMYYETHMRVLGWMDNIPPNVHHVLLSTSVLSGNLHATVRSVKCTYEQHVARVHRVTRGLLASCIQVVTAPRHEVVVYDTNPDHDKQWEESSFGKKP